MKEIWLLNSSITATGTGVEKASYSRANTFAQYFENPIKMISINYSNRLFETIKQLQSTKRLHSRVEVYNLYSYFQGTHANLPAIKNPFQNFFESDLIVEHKVLQRQTIIKTATEKKFHIYKDPQGRIQFINHYMDNKIHQRDFYNEFGYLSKTELLQIDTQSITQELYFRVNGSICLSKRYENNELQLITLYSGSGVPLTSVQTEQELIAIWLDLITMEAGEIHFILERPSRFYHAIKLIDREHITCTAMIHAAHILYGPNYNEKSHLEIPLNENHIAVLTELKEHDYIDSVIVFTEQQRAHIMERFNITDQQRIHCIPNALTALPEQTDFANRDLTTVVYLARYAAVKNHKGALRVIKRVCDVRPDIQFHFYGQGSLKKELQQYAEQLNVQQHVIFHSFMKNTTDIYNKAALSILTSLSEGFSLTILESLAHGTPCVSYDIRYGPNTMITHEKNGLLFQPNDEENMAAGILALLSSSETLEAYSKAAYASVEPFKIETLIDRWKKVFKF